MTIIIYNGILRKNKLFQVLLQQRSSKMVVLSYCSPMDIQYVLQQPHNATVDILAVVAAVDALDRTPYYLDEI
jgi:hypothetical protein